jgi:tetratricopeptide (TPR) repeat protein
VAKYSLKDYPGALADYNKVLELAPSNSLAYFNRGVTKNNIGDKTGACEDWKKAAELGESEAFALIEEFCK